MHSQRARRGSKMFSPPARSSITAKWSGHRCNIVKPPPCITLRTLDHCRAPLCRHHTAGTTLQGTKLQSTTLCRHHAALALQCCKPHCKSVAQQSGCRLQEGRSSSRLPPRIDKRPLHCNPLFLGTDYIQGHQLTLALPNCTNPGIK